MSKIRISCETEGVDIYYTLDGSIPDNSKNLYTSEFEVNEACTVKAIAEKENYISSDIVSYEIQQPNGGAGSTTTSYRIKVYYDEGVEKVDTKERAKRGENVYITITFKENYILNELMIINESSGTEEEITTLGNNEFEFVMPRGPVTIDIASKLL